MTGAKCLLLSSLTPSEGLSISPICQRDLSVAGIDWQESERSAAEPDADDGVKAYVPVPRDTASGF